MIWKHFSKFPKMKLCQLAFGQSFSVTCNAETGLNPRSTRVITRTEDLVEDVTDGNMFRDTSSITFYCCTAVLPTSQTLAACPSLRGHTSHLQCGTPP